MGHSRVFWMFAATLILNGCATDQADRNLDEKLSQQRVTQTVQEIREQAIERIAKSGTINSEEKEKLTALREEIASQDAELREKSLKLRSILVKDVLSQNYDSDEVALVQERLKSVEHERLSILLAAVRQTNVILGRWASKNQRESEQFYDDMMRETGPPGFWF